MSSQLIGRIVKMPTACSRCAGTDAALGAGRGPHAASLLCACGNHLGWLPQAAFNFILETATHFGADAYEPIIIRGALDHAEEVKAMKYEKAFDNTNRGALFKDDRKSKDTDRDYSGTLNVGGTEFWVSGWIKTSAKGTKFLSLSVKPKAEEQAGKPKASRADDMSDSISF